MARIAIAGLPCTEFFIMRIVQRISTLFPIVYVCIGFGYAQTDNDCGLERFRCRNSECIAAELLCNGRADCKDSSDETEIECQKPEILCPDNAFRCKYGACINGDSVCNGIQDCVDNSDETQSQCGTTTGTNNQTGPLSRCTNHQFRCNDGQCIYSSDLCDGHPNCADGSDEISAHCQSISCTSQAFRCAYGACIDGDERCDDIRNCADGSDEDPRLCNRETTRSPSVPTPSPTPATTVLATKTCQAPPQPQNGYWKLHRLQCPNGQECNVPEGTELGLGSYLIYSCNPGYEIRGLTDVTCNIEGKWLSIPVCIEIRCKALSTASVEARCTYGVTDEWVSCESPVLPGTKAALACRNSYQRETNLLSSQRDNVRCNANGQWEPEPIRCVPVCGALPAEYTPLIINGSRPNITEFPWHASLYRDISGESKKYICGASIIQENLLITAAHCVHDENTGRVIDANKIYIVTGNIFRDYDSPLHNPRLVKKNQVKNIYIYCNYLGLIGNYIWDIAILELVEPFALSPWLVPICIDTLSDRAVLEPGTYGKVAGFGRTAVGDSSAVLQALTVPYIPFSQCKSASKNASTDHFITFDKFCAGYTNGSSVCDGDSGSGLVFKTNNLWYLRGIVSVSLGTILHGESARCDHNLYSLYTQISSHIEWIQLVIARIGQNRRHLLSCR